MIRLLPYNRSLLYSLDIQHDDIYVQGNVMYEKSTIGIISNIVIRFIIKLKRVYYLWTS